MSIPVNRAQGNKAAEATMRLFCIDFLYISCKYTPFLHLHSLSPIFLSCSLSPPILSSSPPLPLSSFLFSLLLSSLLFYLLPFSPSLFSPFSSLSFLPLFPLSSRLFPSAPPPSSFPSPLLLFIPSLLSFSPPPVAVVAHLCLRDRDNSHCQLATSLRSSP